MGVDLVGRLMFGVDVTYAREGTPFIQRVLAGEFGDYSPEDPERPEKGLEEFFVMQDREFTVIDEADWMVGEHHRTFVGVELAMVANRDDHVAGGWTESEVMAEVRRAQGVLARHRIRGGGLWLVPAIS